MKVLHLSVLAFLLAGCGGGGGGDGGLRPATRDDLTVVLPASVGVEAGQTVEIDISLSNAHQDRLYVQFEVSSCPPSATCTTVDSVWVEGTVSSVFWIATSTDTPPGEYEVYLRAYTSGVSPDSELESVAVLVQSAPPVWYEDADGDGYSSGDSIRAADRPDGHFRADELVATDGDCDDANDLVFPGGVDIDGDGIDQDCNGFEIGGPTEVVFDWTTDRCEDMDIPDLPARAFRDASGQVQMIASHFSVRPFVGAELDTVVRQCGVVMTSDRDADPANFNDAEWIGATYTEDGETIYAVVHNEYHGQDHPGQCTTDWYQCWYNGLTLVVSTDRGASYQHPATPPDHLIASFPETYLIDEGPYGVFHPSNIVKGVDGLYYEIVHVVDPDGLQYGCLMRSQDLSDPDSWRFWDGFGFDGQFINPYTEVVANIAQHLCTAVDTADISDMTSSLTYNEHLGQYILVGVSSDGVDWGVYYSLSDDLIDWTERRLLLDVLPTWAAIQGEAAFLYPSLLDPNSPSRNFETVGETAYLYITRFNPGGSHLDRDLLRIPLQFFLY